MRGMRKMMLVELKLFLRGPEAFFFGMVLFFPMIFLSGTTFPWKILPDGVKMVGRAMPLTYVVQLLQGIWFAEPCASIS